MGSMTQMLEGFAEQCMAEYDLDGWNLPGFFNPDDVSIVGRDWG